MIRSVLWHCVLNVAASFCEPRCRVAADVVRPAAVVAPLAASLDVNLSGSGFKWMMSTPYRRAEALYRRQCKMEAALQSLLSAKIEAGTIPAVSPRCLCVCGSVRQLYTTLQSLPVLVVALAAWCDVAALPGVTVAGLYVV